MNHISSQKVCSHLENETLSTLFFSLQKQSVKEIKPEKLQSKGECTNVVLMRLIKSLSPIPFQRIYSAL